MSPQGDMQHIPKIPSNGCLVHKCLKSKVHHLVHLIKKKNLQVCGITNVLKI